ncbi:MAG: hypothetical protein K5897_10525 [Eubacterium sp.]|nr:hypothetical protein [Eubacterium sp.]
MNNDEGNETVMEEKVGSKRYGSEAEFIADITSLELYQVEEIVRLYAFGTKGIQKLSAEKENELVTKMQNGDPDAKRALIDAKLYIVSENVKEFVGHGYGGSFWDIVEIGIQELLRIVEIVSQCKGGQFYVFTEEKIWATTADKLAERQDEREFERYVHLIMCLPRLPESEQKVMCYYYGLLGECPHSALETGERFDLRREEVLAIRTKMQKRKHIDRSTRSRLLREFLEDE